MPHAKALAARVEQAHAPRDVGIGRARRKRHLRKAVQGAAVERGRSALEGGAVQDVRLHKVLEHVASVGQLRREPVGGVRVLHDCAERRYLREGDGNAEVRGRGSYAARCEQDRGRVAAGVARVRARIARYAGGLSHGARHGRAPRVRARAIGCGIDDAHEVHVRLHGAAHRVVACAQQDGAVRPRGHLDRPRAGKRLQRPALQQVDNEARRRVRPRSALVHVHRELDVDGVVVRLLQRVHDGANRVREAAVRREPRARGERDVAGVTTLA